MHALLAHLRTAGFEGAPRPLGIDDRGREALSFIPGTVPWPDQFDLLEPQQRLAQAAELIREFTMRSPVPSSPQAPAGRC